MAVDIYHYTAAANPYFVKALAHKYNYVHEPSQPLHSVLRQLVMYEGRPVLDEIIENSQDKELYKEYFEEKYGKPNPNCKCSEKEPVKALEAYMNFSGQMQIAQQQAENKRITGETSMMVLAGAVLIAFAIIMTKR